MATVWIIFVELIDRVVDLFEHFSDLLIVFVIRRRVPQTGPLLITISLTQRRCVTLNVHQPISIIALMFCLGGYVEHSCLIPDMRFLVNPDIADRVKHLLLVHSF